MDKWNDLQRKKPKHQQKCLVYSYLYFDEIRDNYIDPILSVKTWVEITPSNGYWEGEAFRVRTPTFWTEISDLPNIEEATFFY